MKRAGRKSAFSLEERRRIVSEYDQGDLSAKALCQKYGIRSSSVIFAWRKSCFSSESEKVVPLRFTSESSGMNDNPTAENKSLREKILALEKRLYESELRNKALNNLIDIAEEQGLKIRKNFGAKR